MARKIPTFKRQGELLTGQAALRAWREQPARCACGSKGCEAEAICGQVGTLRAQWLGCNYCRGSTVGRPLVYRTASQIEHETRG